MEDDTQRVPHGAARPRVRRVVNGTDAADGAAEVRPLHADGVDERPRESVGVPSEHGERPRVQLQRVLEATRTLLDDSRVGGKLSQQGGEGGEARALVHLRGELDEQAGCSQGQLVGQRGRRGVEARRVEQRKDEHVQRAAGRAARTDVGRAEERREKRLVPSGCRREASQSPLARSRRRERRRERPVSNPFRPQLPPKHGPHSGLHGLPRTGRRGGLQTPAECDAARVF